MSSQAPGPGPHRQVRSFLLYAFGISIALHVLLGPLLVRWREPETQHETVTKVSVTKRIAVVVPTPPPPPTPTPPPRPTPTPPPKQTPKPKAKTQPPKAAHLLVHTPHTHARTVTGPTEPTLPVQPGTENGNPLGKGTTGGNQGAATGPSGPPAPPAPPPPPPTPSPTPRLACANPNVPPKTLNAVAPDTPEIAREQGIVGTVEVRVDLNEKSQIVGISIFRSPNPLLNKAAMDAAKASTFQTEIQNCQPIASSYRYVVEFQSE